MKKNAQTLLVLLILPVGLVSSACRAEAEETKPAQPEEAETAAAAPGTTGTADTTAQAEPGSSSETAGEEVIPEDAEFAEGDTNVVINQEITVLKELPPSAPPDLDISEGVEAIVKLAQSGVSEAVILTFIETNDHEYNLDAADILYLNDIGISPTVLAAMLNHDGASDELKNLVGDDQIAVAEAPPEMEADAGATEPISRSILTGDFGAAQSTAPTAEVPMEVTTNYVASETQVVEQPVIVEQPVVVQQPVVYTQPAVTHSYFYSSLAPYGSWIFVADYGWCWQPTVAVSYSGWRPYTHGGHWLYTDAGWYWKSSYSWGWAPFHYGRWFCPPGRGWVWVPDYKWGPSWVTWRRNSYYSGWAPLPPRAHYRPGIGFTYFGRRVGVGFHFGLSHSHYSFVRTRDFCDPRLVHRVLPTARTVNIYNNSTVVNNYVVGNNNTIINQGIDREVVERQVRREIPKVGIRDLPSQPGRLVQPERLAKAGDNLVVYRPKPPTPTLAATSERLQSEQLRRVRESDLVRPTQPTGRNGLTGVTRPGSVGSPVAGSRTRTEISRNGGSPAAAAPTTSRGTVTAGRQPTTSGLDSTWARPAPFVSPAPEPAVPSGRAAATSRAEVSRRATPASPGSRVGGGLVTTRPGTSQGALPSRAITPRQTTPGSTVPVDIPGARLRQPTARPTTSGATVGNANVPAQTPWTARGTTSPWQSRRESVARVPGAATTPTPATPSGRSRLEVTRPSTPGLGRSVVPGANVGGRVETARPSVPTRSINPAVRPSTPVPANSVPSVPSGPFGRRESIARPPVAAPQPTGRAASPVYQRPQTVAPQPTGRAASPVYQRPAPVAPQRPAGRAASPVYQRPTVAPAPTGRAASPVYQRPAPSAPAARPPTVTPRAAAPVRPAPAIRSAPAPAPAVRSAPAPASRPAAPAATGRGRTEIRR